MKARKVISDEARRALEYVHGRIMSIAAVQKHLHAPAVGGSIALIPYLTSLCEAISHSMVSDDQPISIEVRCQGGNVNRQKAESLGLIALNS
jgi:chemotaxis protein methyltransferase CheR